MNDDYLWQGEGDDPQLRALERQLGEFAYHGELPRALPARTSARRRGYALGLAAAVVLAGVGLWLAFRTDVPQPLERVADAEVAVPAAGERAAVRGWALRGQVGATRCDGGDGGQACELAVGEVIEADARLDVAVADIGTLSLEPRTRLGLIATGAGEHRLKLERGTIHARVLAPPRLLVVETPGATAVDLGCSYTLSVDAAGAGFLAVETGAVALEHATYSVHVPAGARTETRPGAAPGVPYFEDASEPLRRAIERLSFETDIPGVLATVLRLARPRDTLSLWHLLPRVTVDERAGVVRRIAALVAVDPSEISEADLVRLDPDALGRLRSQLEQVWG